jgi:hypothetical protein
VSVLADVKRRDVIRMSRPQRTRRMSQGGERVVTPVSSACRLIAAVSVSAEHADCESVDNDRALGAVHR